MAYYTVMYSYTTVRTRLEFSETDLRTVSGYDQFAVNSSQVEFLLTVRTNILVKHPPDQIYFNAPMQHGQSQFMMTVGPIMCRLTMTSVTKFIGWKLTKSRILTWIVITLEEKQKKGFWLYLWGNALLTEIRHVLCAMLNYEQLS